MALITSRRHTQTLLREGRLLHLYVEIYVSSAARNNAMDFITWITRQTSWVDLTPLPQEALNRAFIDQYLSTQQQQDLTALMSNGGTDEEQLTLTAPM